MIYTLVSAAFFRNGMRQHVHLPSGLWEGEREVSYAHLSGRLPGIQIFVVSYAQVSELDN
jgi:hypothetical protein